MRTRPHFVLFAMILLSCLSLDPALAAPAATEPSSNYPPQTNQISILHRSGQTFVTWAERTDLRGEAYRVYRYGSPIDAENLAQAKLLYQVPEGSAFFYANRYRRNGLGPWANRYVERYVIGDHARQLPEGTGLLVWTLAKEDLDDGSGDSAYYAVTTVIDGTENVADLGANVAGPIHESVANPKPVEINADVPHGWHVYVQYMDLRSWNPTFHAPNATNHYYGLDPTHPGVAGAIQYAYDYTVYSPGPEQCGGLVPASLPVLVSLHAWGGNSYAPPAQASELCAYTISPVDVSETWWFGFARNHDFRQGGAPTTGDVIVNYTEQRVLRMLVDLMRDPPGPPVDSDRVYVSGHSMGGSGVLALALRYPNVFAAAYASKPMTNYRDAGGWKPDVATKWGTSELNLPVEIHAPAGWADHLSRYAGTGVWDWQDHQMNLRDRQSDEMVPLGVAHGINDANIIWNTQGQPAYAALNAGRQAWGGAITADGHDWGAYRGSLPNLMLDDAGVPFAGLTAVWDETVPGLANASSNPPLPPESIGRYNQTLLWSSSWSPWDGAPVDEPELWQISICSVDGSMPAAECGTGITQTVDVTPRRLQRFQITPGATYRWENRRVEDNVLVELGQVVPDAYGLLTVRDLQVLPLGSRLSISPAEPSYALYLPSLGR